MSIAESPRSPLVVWRFSDGRRGHDNQSIGLVDALSELVPVVRHDIDVGQTPATLTDFLLGRYPALSPLPAPRLLVGAGHATHLPMLIARRARGGRIVVLMRPTLPLRFFDLCVVPRHDGVVGSERVFVTDGAINRIRPAPRQDERAALILIGGPSPHVDWDDSAVQSLIASIIAAAPTLEWQIADSRRTPSAFMESLRRSFAETANVQTIHWQDVDGGWLAARMPQCATIWVTSDSVSMLYEALSSGATVGVLSVQPRGASRLSRGLEDLQRRGWLLDPGQWPAAHGGHRERPRLDEAGRCARHIVDAWLTRS